MSTVWSFQYYIAGAWSASVLFTDAQVVSATRTLVNQGIDTVSMVFAGTQPPGAGGFNPGSLIRIFRDDYDGAGGASNPKGWFTGRIVAPKKATLGNSESCTVLLNGPWWYLAQIVYQQLGLYYLPTGTTTPGTDSIVETSLGPVVYFGAVAVTVNPTPVQQVASDIILTQNQQDGVPMDGAQTLSDALTYAISKKARLQIGSLPVDQAIPSESATDPTCADVVKKVLKWLPTVVAWFDYTTDPPTLNFADRTTRTPQTLIMGGNAPQVQTATLQARPDLVLPGVTLYYLRKLTLSAVTDTSTAVTDANGNTVTTDEPTPGSTTPISGGFQINGGYVTQAAVKSQLAAGGSSTTTTTTASIQANVLQIDTAGPDPSGIGAMVATIELQGGNIPSTGATTPSPAFEPTPVGLAKTIYESRQLLSYEGSIVLKGQDLVNLANPIGNVFNISGGEPEWAAMRAEVQTCVENTATAATTLTVGAPNHLGPSDLAALLQANRLRQYVSLADSLGRTTGGAAIPPQNPVPPQPPSPPKGGGGGGQGGGAGDGNDGAQPTGQTGAGILDSYAGTYKVGPTDRGAAYPNGFNGAPNPSGLTFLQDPPRGGNPVLVASGGGGLNFYHNIAGSDSIYGDEGHPNSPGGVDWIGNSTCTESYNQGSLDLTGFSPMQIAYAELRGSHTHSNADGTSTTVPYYIPVSQYLGMRQPNFRVYCPDDATNHSYQSGTGFSRDYSESLTITGLFVIPR